MLQDILVVIIVAAALLFSLPLKRKLKKSSCSSCSNCSDSQCQLKQLAVPKRENK